MTWLQMTESCILSSTSRVLSGPILTGIRCVSATEIAIPHARLEGIESSVLAIGVSKLGIYDPGSSNTATIMFLMLSPVSRPDSHV